VGITLLAEPIILLLFKPEYIPSILALQIVVWVLPFIFVNYIQGSLLTAMNRQVTYLKITAASLVLNVGMNLVLIPLYSYLGAAFVTVITEIFSVALGFYVLSKLLAKVKVHEIIFKPAIACLVMALFILLVQTNLFLEIAISAVIYFVVLIALKGFTPEDYDLFRQILNIKRITKDLSKRVGDSILYLTLRIHSPYSDLISRATLLYSFSISDAGFFEWYSFISFNLA